MPHAVPVPNDPMPTLPAAYVAARETAVAEVGRSCTAAKAALSVPAWAWRLCCATSLSGVYGPLFSNKFLKGKAMVRIEQSGTLTEAEETAPSGSSWAFCS